MTDQNDKKLRGKQIKELFDLCAEVSRSQQVDLIEGSEFSEDIKSHVKKLLQYNTEEIDLTEAIIDSVQVLSLIHI